MVVTFTLEVQDAHDAFQAWPWRFVDGNVTIPDDENETRDYNKKATKAFALNISNLHTFNIVKMSKTYRKHSLGCMKARPSETNCFFKGNLHHHLLAHINMVKSFVDQLCSIEVMIEDKDTYMVLFMSLFPSFDNLVTSLDSMSTKDVNFQFIIT
jgi:hypothetical protein